MFTRILTDLERRRIKNYLRADGERGAPIRKIVNRGRSYLPWIKADLDLLEKLLTTYDSHVKKD
jgi:hypothetical protein